MKNMYGSIQNRVMEGRKVILPEVGMGATIYSYTDRYAYTIVEVSKETVKVELNGEVIKYPKYIIASEDNYKIISGSMQYGSAEYEFTPGTSREKYVFHKQTMKYRKEIIEWVKDETITEEVSAREKLPYIGIRPVETGRTKKAMQAITLGVKDKYYDPHF